MAINFPDSPTIGDEYTANGFVWTWTGAAWEKVGASTAAANDFALLVGATGNTTYVLDRAYTAGRYTLSFANGDTTYDIYFVAEDGTYAGYTNGSVAEVSANFAEVVVLGADTNETILFAYQGTLTSPSSTGDVAVAGAFINSVVTSSLPNIDDTTVVNGGNFAADVQVSFIGQDTTETAAKAVVRSSSTQLVVTRPDSFSPDNSPYTVKVVNPGIPVPAGTNAHLLSNAVTAGTNPSWVTGADIYYNVGGATSITLLATDTEGSDIDYSLVSGTLPAGLTLDGETGVISGTFSGSANEGDITNITVRATDAGGNFLDKAFNLTANTAPTWTTPAGELDLAAPDSAYSFQLEASTGSVGGALTYTLASGALLTGHTLSSTGLISGTSSDPVDTVANFTVRVTDEGGLFADRAFSVTVGQLSYWDLGVTYDNPSPSNIAIGSGGRYTDVFYGFSGDSSGYMLHYSFDGQNWSAQDQSSFTSNTGSALQIQPTLKSGSNYYGLSYYYNNGQSGTIGVCRWGRSGDTLSPFTYNEYAYSYNRYYGFVTFWKKGANQGLLRVSGQIYDLNVAIYYINNGTITSGNSGSWGYNSSYGGSSIFPSGTGGYSYYYMGKGWEGSENYRYNYADASTGSISSTIYTDSAYSLNSYFMLANGATILNSGSAFSGGTYLRAQYTSGENLRGMVPNASSYTYPTGCDGSFVMSEDGGKVRVFAPTGVFESTDLISWTYTQAGDAYSGIPRVITSSANTAQEIGMWRGSTNIVYNRGVRTK